MKTYRVQLWTRTRPPYSAEVLVEDDSESGAVNQAIIRCAEDRPEIPATAYNVKQVKEVRSCGTTAA